MPVHKHHHCTHPHTFWKTTCCRRERPTYKLVLEYKKPVDGAVRKRQYASVYTYLRKHWEDIPTLRDNVVKYIARAEGPLPTHVSWGPHVLYSECQVFFTMRTAAATLHTLATQHQQTIASFFRMHASSAALRHTLSLHHAHVLRRGGGEAREDRG